jgi:hypothetical protein
LAMPAPPGSAWTGIRGNRGMMFTGRGFMSSPLYPGDGYTVGQWGERRPRRTRRTVVEQAQPHPPVQDHPAAQASNNRLLFANPFRGLRLPRRAPRNASSEPATVPAPAQLEEVVVR